MDYWSRIPSYQAVPVDASQQLEPSGSQSEHLHPNALSLAGLSPNTQRALDDLDHVEPQPSGHHQLLALLVRSGIADGALQIQWSQGAEAHYKQEVDAPSTTGTMGERQVGNLTVRTKLNEQFQHDIIGIDFHMPSSGATASINLPDPPPAVRSNNEPSIMSEDQQFSRLAALYSRSQFAQASIGRSNPQDVLGKLGQTGHFEPYRTSLASLLHSKSSTSSVDRAGQGQVPDPKNPGETINQHVLSKRKYNQTQMPDPKNPGRTTSQNALHHRKYGEKKIPDPQKPGRMISQNALNKRKCDRQQVPDPRNPGQTTSRRARNYWIRAQKQEGPEKSGTDDFPRHVESSEAGADPIVRN